MDKYLLVVIIFLIVSILIAFFDPATGFREEPYIPLFYISIAGISIIVENLTGAGLINRIEFDGKNTFVITPKGRQYLESYQNFSTIAESFGLEL